MSSERPEYYLARAAEERAAAARSPNASLARVHDDLAAMYDRMAREAEREPALANRPCLGVAGMHRHCLDFMTTCPPH